MTNNDLLRRLRYLLKINNQQLMTLFKLGQVDIDEAQLMVWLKREEDDGYRSMPDHAMAQFLNGLIVQRRGEPESAMPVETELTNNQVLRKLKIAFDLKSDDILKTLDYADFRLGKSELTAFFRKPTHKHYRECKDQVLRNFIKGLQIKLNPPQVPESKANQ